MKVGTKVKFIGELEGFTREAQIILRRDGQIVQTTSAGPHIYRLREGQVVVCWIPRTKRGTQTLYKHYSHELQEI